MKKKIEKKRNAQDATRKHDVDPVRRRVKALEFDAREIENNVFTLTERVTAVEKQLAETRWRA